MVLISLLALAVALALVLLAVGDCLLGRARLQSTLAFVGHAALSAAAIVAAVLALGAVARALLQ